MELYCDQEGDALYVRGTELSVIVLARSSLNCACANLLTRHYYYAQGLAPATEYVFTLANLGPRGSVGTDLSPSHYLIYHLTPSNPVRPLFTPHDVDIRRR